MPLYDFGCEDCGYTVEMLTKSAGSSEIVLTCPECEKETMKRQVGLSSFQLKGGGWYKDGYTKKPKWYIYEIEMLALGASADDYWLRPSQWV